jgi:hypothetical protein
MKQINSKYFLLALLNLSLVTTVIAQSPVLTAANSNPFIGESFTGNGINYTNPGSGGVNQTWNFSSLTSSSTQTDIIVDATTTTNASSFPNASFATYTASNSFYNYFSATSSALSIEGYVYGPPSNLIIPYSDPQIVLTYPFSMGSTFIDNYSGTYTSGPNTIIRTGVDTVTADGYGTLILPNGTFTNALRVLVIDNYADTTSLGAPYALFTMTTYNWYIPGTHYQVMSLSTLTSNGGPPLAQFGTYLDANSIGTSVNDLSDADVNLYPNPASEKLFVQSKGNIKSLKCIDFSGQTVELKNENNSIDISGLSNGIYFLDIIMENGKSVSMKFVKE